MSSPEPQSPDTVCEYIEGEYGEELPIIRFIVSRTLGARLLQLEESAVEAMVYNIVGYYTGCLNPDGSSRVGRGYKR